MAPVHPASSEPSTAPTSEPAAAAAPPSPTAGAVAPEASLASPLLAADEELRKPRVSLTDKAVSSLLSAAATAVAIVSRSPRVSSSVPGYEPLSPSAPEPLDLEMGEEGMLETKAKPAAKDSPRRRMALRVLLIFFLLVRARPLSLPLSRLARNLQSPER
jgi:hypothetical protein